MKKLLFILAILPGALFGAGAGGINLTPNVNGAITNRISTFTQVWSDEGVALVGGDVKKVDCTGAGITCTQTNSSVTISVTASGGPGGASNATLQSPATGPYNLNGVGAIINSTGVALTSGTISIGFQVKIGTNNWTFLGDASSSMTFVVGGSTYFFGNGFTTMSVTNFNFYMGASTYTFNGSTFTVQGASVAIVGPNVALIVGSAPVSGLTIASGFMILTTSQTTRDLEGTGTAGGISASTYTRNGIPIVTSTWSVRGYDGFITVVTSGSIAANTTISITAANLGLSVIGIPVCGELEGVNTAGLSVRLKDTLTPTLMEVYNSDIVNIKKFVCHVAGRP